MQIKIKLQRLQEYGSGLFGQPVILCDLETSRLDETLDDDNLSESIDRVRDASQSDIHHRACSCCRLL